MLLIIIVFAYTTHADVVIKYKRVGSKKFIL
jgi:hypothetical protein